MTDDTRRGLGIVGLGVVVCGVCCAGPILAFLGGLGLGGLGLAGLAGTFFVGGVALIPIAIAVVGYVAVRSSHTPCAGPETSVPLAAPSRRTPQTTDAP